MTEDMNAIVEEIRSLYAKQRIARRKLSAAMDAAKMWRDADNEVSRLVDAKKRELIELAKNV